MTNAGYHYGDESGKKVTAHHNKHTIQIFRFLSPSNSLTSNAHHAYKLVCGYVPPTMQAFEPVGVLFFIRGTLNGTLEE
jgi:hypothetical protein